MVSVSANSLKGLLEINEERITAKLGEQIEFPKPILFYGNEGLIYPNTINIIQGKSGVHKSRLEGHLISSLISKTDVSMAGFKKHPIYRVKVLMIDTERAINDLLPYSLQSIISQAGYDSKVKPHNFSATSMANVQRIERLNELRKYLEKFYHNLEDNEYGVVFLDIISDMIQDFNNISNSYELIDLLNELINSYNLTFVAVIHENPGISEKSRGHLGSELNNKSATVIQISGDKSKEGKKSNSIFKVSILKTRYGAPIEDQFYTYDNSLKQLISVDAEIGNAYFTGETKTKANPDELIHFLINRYGFGIEIKKADVIKSMMKEFNCSDKTITNRINDFIHSLDKNTIKLNQFKKGRDSYLIIEQQLNLTEEKKAPI